MAGYPAVSGTDLWLNIDLRDQLKEHFENPLDTL
jgi:hypothetical protein